MADDDDFMLLNLDSTGFQVSAHTQKRQRRPLKWSEKKQQRRQQGRGDNRGAGGRGRGAFPSSREAAAAGQQEQAGSGIGGQEAAGGGQLKGYTLHLEEEPARPAEPAAAAPGPGKARSMSRKPASFSFGFGASGNQAASGRPAANDSSRQQPKQQQQQRDRLTPGDGSPEAPPARRQPEQQQQPKQQQQRRQQQQLNGRSGQQRQAREPRAAPAAAPAAAGAAGTAAGPQPKVGRLRLASRQAGYRERTPDLSEDEVVPAGSDAEPDDVLAAVAAVARRDRALQQELAAAAGGSGKGKPGGAGTLNAGRRSAGAGAGGDGHSSGDSDSDASPGGVVDFYYSSGDERRQARPTKRQRQQASESAAAAAGKAGGAAKAASKPGRAGAAFVRPGELVHADGAAGMAAMPLAARQALFPAAADTDTAAEPAAKGSDAGHTGGSGFRGLGLSQELADHLATLGFAAPTAVQQRAVPPLLAGRDALVNAPTGSGKTLAYLAPLVQQLAAQQPCITRGEGTYAVVITPTRELCLQVADVLTLLVRRYVWLVGGAIHGGEHRGKEKARLRKGVTILVATPGRLLDHLQNTTSFQTQELRWVVLDEADRLLDLGFEKQIAEILGLLDQRAAAADYRRRRQTAVLSATLHSNLGALASLSLHNPVVIGFSCRVEDGRLVVGKAQDGEPLVATPGTAAAAAELGAAAGRALEPGGGSGSDREEGDRQGGRQQQQPAGMQQEGSGQKFELPPQLRQRYIEVPCKLRLVALAALLRARLAAAPTKAKVVVFLSCCDAVEYYHSVLGGRAWEEAAGEPLLAGGGGRVASLGGAGSSERHGKSSTAPPVLKLHGNMDQADRTRAFLSFCKAPAGVLLCTDVAARGLDFPSVTIIVQFDPPGDAAEYVHRAGRTARLGQVGEAVLFLMPSEHDYLQHLSAQGITLQEEQAVPLLNRVLGTDAKAGRGIPLERHSGAYALQKRLLDAVAADKALCRLGGDAFRSWVRAYATHASGVKHIFHVRRLHLGHVAHAFALKERPSLVGKSSGKQEAKRKRAGTAAGGGSKKQAAGSGSGSKKARTGSGSGGHERSKLQRQQQKGDAAALGMKGGGYHLT